MSNGTRTRITRATKLSAAIGGAAAVAALSAMPAFAAGTITAVSPTPLVDATTATVTGTGFAANADLRVGLCSTDTYGLLAIPACGEFTDTTTDGSGNLSAAFVAYENGVNNHYNPLNPVFWGQPSTLDCTAPGSCEIVITSHSGTSSTTEATAPANF
ncbi:hypothetical protein NODU109028_17315 [Nocardioides dubius]|uniref:Neocarzinostatin family protein n=1 Tax=Nocardioides dubius TaxID=317019 RepID=A0ABP4EEH2_9ACTN